MSKTETWLYSVGDGVSPGSYHRVDGVALCTEGSDKIGENETAIDAARELKECYMQSCQDDEDEPEIAIVIKTYDDDDDLIEEVIEAIV